MRRPRRPLRAVRRALIAPVVVAAATVVASIDAVIALDTPKASARPAVERQTQIAATGSTSATGTAASTDTHGYPRLFHLWGGPWQKLPRYDLVVVFPTYDLHVLRTANPNGIYLMQPSYDAGDGQLHPTHVTYGGESLFKGATDRYAGGTNLGSIRPWNPTWDAMHNADGSTARINGGTSGIDGWNLADQACGHDTPTEVAKIFAYAAKADGLYSNPDHWDGVFSDNWIFGAIGSSWYYGTRIDACRDGSADDRATLRHDWNDGLVQAGSLIRSYLPGMIVGGNGNWFDPSSYNGTDPEGWLKTSNFTMVENFNQFYNTPGDFVAQSRRWLDYRDPMGQPRYMAVLQDALTTDGSKYALPAGWDANDPRAMLDSGVLKSMRWGLTLALMSDVYYEVCPDQQHDAAWYYDEYDGGSLHKRGYLGMPLGAPQQLSNGLYRRDFDNGIALNNSTATTLSVNLGGTFKHLSGTQNPRLNDGSTVTSVTVPAHDGVILLRTAPAPTPSPSVGPGSSRSIGYGTVGKSIDGGAAGWLDASGPYVLTGSGRITKLVGDVGASNAPLHVRAVVYADDHGAPAGLVAVSNELTLPPGTPPGWRDFTLPSAISIAAGTYWLGYWYGSTGRFVYDTNSGAERYARATYAASGPPPATYPTPATSHSRYSLYAVVAST